jgi:hypothetical protein
MQKSKGRKVEIEGGDGEGNSRQERREGQRSCRAPSLPLGSIGGAFISYCFLFIGSLAFFLRASS